MIEPILLFTRGCSLPQGLVAVLEADGLGVLELAGVEGADADADLDGVVVVRHIFEGRVREGGGTDQLIWERRDIGVCCGG